MYKAQMEEMEEDVPRKLSGIVYSLRHPAASGARTKVTGAFDLCLSPSAWPIEMRPKWGTGNGCSRVPRALIGQVSVSLGLGPGSGEL